MRTVKKGDRVLQPNYGTGTVTDVNDEHTVIDFDEHGIRKFVTNLVSLSLTERPAPERPARRRGRKKPATPAAK